MLISIFLVGEETCRVLASASRVLLALDPLAYPRLVVEEALAAWLSLVAFQSVDVALGTWNDLLGTRVPGLFAGATRSTSGSPLAELTNIVGRFSYGVEDAVRLSDWAACSCPNFS